MGILPGGDEKFSGDVEVDETYIGGKEGNRHASKKLRLGRGIAGKKPVVGVKHRETGYIKAKVIDDTNEKRCRVSSRKMLRSVAGFTLTKR